jgi:Mn2+/Fe2+ NRAMP family transporter
MQRISKMVSVILGIPRGVALLALTVAAVFAVQASAVATEYKVEYSKLVTPAEANFGEAVTAVLAIVGLIIGIYLGFRMIRKLVKA